MELDDVLEYYSEFENGKRIYLPPISLPSDIQRQRMKKDKNPLLCYSLQRQAEDNVNIVLSEVFSLAERRLSTLVPLTEKKKEPTLPRFVFRRMLEKSAEKNWPPPMTESWKKLIWERIPKKLAARFPDVNAQLEREVDHMYNKTLQSQSIAERLKPLPSEERHHVIIKEYREGFTENYHEFLATRAYIQQRLLLTHSLMVKVLDTSTTFVPRLLNDFTKYRNLGPITLISWKMQVTNDLRKSENLVHQGMYSKIVKLLLKQGCLDDVPKEYWPQFIKCTTYIMVNLVIESMKRTLDNVVKMTGNIHKVPYLKLDLVYEEGEGILLIPNKKAVIAAYLQIVDDIAGIAQKLDPLESWVSVPVPVGYISVKIHEEHIEAAKRKMEENLEQLYDPIEKYRLELVEKFCSLYDISLRMEIDNFLCSEVGKFSESCEKIKYLREFYYRIMQLTSNKLFDIVKVNQIDVVNSMMLFFSDYSDRILSQMLDRHQERSSRICERFEKLVVRALSVPEDTEELMKLGKYMGWATTAFIDKMKEEILKVIKELTHLIDMTTFTEEHIYLNSQAILWLHQIKPVFQQNTMLFELYKGKFEEELTRTTDLLVKRVEDLFPSLSVLDMMDDASRVTEYLPMIRRFYRKLEEFDKTIAWINKEEALFQFPYSTYPELDELKAMIHPFGELIFLIHKWHRTYKLWMNGDFEIIEAVKVEETTDEFHKELLKRQQIYRTKLRQQTTENYPRRFKGNVEDPEFVNLPAPIKLCLRAIEHIKDFRQNIPLAKIMCNPALTQRHWDEISEIAGFDLTPDAGTTLRKIISMKLENHLDKFEIISISAMKEKQLKENLTKMLQEWTEINFTITIWKETDIAILSQLDDVQAIMDDHLIKTLSMRGSAFVKPFEDEVREWYFTLMRMIETIDKWGKVQAQWLYLLPIFSSSDILSQMPKEGALFQEVDKTYRGLMASIQADSRVTTTAGVKKTYETLQICTGKLEEINDGVNAYLEKKRLYFPRFFFLSNDEMLEILSETKDPMKVQPHLKKCFEGIEKLAFDEDLCIEAMFSAEGEKINFVSQIYTKAARGSVEKWLIEVEQQMKTSIRSEIANSYNEYSKRERKEWVLQSPGQVVLSVSMIYWTAEVHKFLAPNSLIFLRNYYEELHRQLNDIVALVRGNLSGQARITLGALVVLDVHAKDIVEELIKKEVSSRKDFQWLAQLRYYWEQDVQIHIINAVVNYAYEYLGNTARLVITPLTDRCYRTLIGAYHLHLNGAPEGPAGTGKTETIKDLAKALAIHCVVFNCSDGLDYIAMGKFFKGLAASGAWACFDEFNRIELEVLSVIAQQILSIIQAVRAGQKKFMFAGTELNLNPACYVCITMNPGYAGRSELPDNLKVLFRTVAMVVPDYALIGEISLYSYGFVNARTLSVKIVTAYRLCSQQLSSHSHYDYGLRAMKTVLSTAGNLKLKYPDVSEDSIVLRSIADVNVPKFLSHDIPLFEGIISDLFPGVSPPSPNYDIFINTAKEVCKSRQLQPTEVFLTKLIETYDIMQVRHGIMLVGEPFGGKTSILKVLASTLISLEEQGKQERKVVYEIINPKAVTLGQLYGQFDPVSHEWTDGIVAKMFRQFSGDTSDERKWMVFDGPVDSFWIENMNTVLDDNKKLCLTSGEVIHQTKSMSMIFEVMDLSQASLATVSRCGMIFLEPLALGWKPLVISWIEGGNPAWKDGNEKLLEDMFDWLAPPSLQFIKKNCVQLVTPGVTNLIKSAILLINMLLDEAIEQNEDTKPVRSWIQAAFVYAGIWSFGGTLDPDSQVKFDEFYKSIWKGQNQDCPVPESLEKVDISIPLEGTLYDYVYNFKQKGNWKNWPEILKGIKIDEMINVQQSLIPTAESLRYQYLMEMHIRNNSPMLLIGPTGTGKSFFTQDMMINKMSDEKFVPAFIPFSSQTTVTQTQELIISKLNKRRRGLYGPQVNKKCVIFVDDMNMPAKEIYGAQPPLELLRQYFDHGHWYDVVDTVKIFILDVLILAAMGIPGGSRQEIYQRFLRHFSIYTTNPFTEDSMARIFSNILLISLKRNGFAADVATSIASIVSATLDVYEGAIRYLLPTPAKSHYIFNLRDFSRVIHGCILLKKESVFDAKKAFIKIWVHEVLRVFYDRLVDSEDRLWLYNKLRYCVEEYFKESFDASLDSLPMENRVVTEDSLRHLLFGNFMDPNASEEERKYEEIPSLEALTKIAEMALAEYNATHRPKMDIVLFRYALEHLSHICRMISTPCGSGLLVGVGGSGRQSLTRLAAAILGTVLYQPEITENYGVNEWRSDLKKVLRESGGVGKETTFLLTDGQIKEETFLQDIDSLLNSGEVPNLFAIDEQQEILELVRLAAQGGNRNLDISALSVFSFFINRCRQKTHLILCFSPIGPKFRSRLRLYPSLINCCTIDWFMTWPEEALEMVAQRYMADINLHYEVKSAAISACKYFHVSARQISAEFYKEEGRKTYMTSAAYLELIHSFTQLTNEKQDEITQAKLRYIGGLDKLHFAAEQVAVMQVELSELKPQLVLAAEGTRRMMKEIEKETIKVGTASDLVRKDEKVANIQAAKAQELKVECEADLAQAIPILEDAIAALNTLKPTDITVVKSMKNPPDAIKLVMAAVCVMKNVKPDRIIDPASGRMTNDYWGPSKRVLGDMYFLQSLKEFDKDNIAPAIMKKIRTEYLPNKDFKPSTVAKASSAAEGLCKWVIAMDMYDKVAKEVAPKKGKLEIAESEYNATLALLEEKRNQLRTLEEQLADLHSKLNEANVRKQALEDDVTLCANKLMRAEKLIGGLGGEKARWSAAADALQHDYDSLAGDILICCGFMCYLAPFTSPYRRKCVEDWRTYISELKIPCSGDCSLRKVLGSDIKIQTWNIAGLPNDSFSIENAIIVDKCRRYSLLVDPQGQANKWIKVLEKPNGLKSIKFSDDGFMKRLHSCLEFGYPLLIEGIGEVLEPSVEPLLNKQIYHQGESSYIRLGDSVIEFNKKFKLYLTTKLRNPHFMPDIYNRVTIVNFSLTLEGLEDQLLGIVVAKERPDLEHRRRSLIVQSAANETALKDVEDSILITLSETKGNILEDESAINVLDTAKTLAQDIMEKEAKAQETAVMIDSFRLSYRPIAQHSATLYYCLTDLPNIDPMYQYSLGWFINLFNISIEGSNKAREVEKRMEFIADAFTYNLYTNVCLSLFEKDRLLFSFVLCTNIMISKGKLDKNELRFFLTGGTVVENNLENPQPTWLSDRRWDEICRLDSLPVFNGFLGSFCSAIMEWKEYYDQVDFQETDVPSPWNKKLSVFQKLIIVRIFHPDKILTVVEKFVEMEIGKKYMTPPSFDIARSYSDSNCLCPLIFILSPGADPMAALMALARKLGKKLQWISLGQGQGPVARSLIKEGKEDGHWVCLQNCHLAVSWMPMLEKLWEEMDTSNTNLNFRLWLTSYPSDKFPSSVLQAGVKITNEPPTGLQQNLLRSFLSEPVKEPEFFCGCPGKEKEFSKLLYALCFFHAVVQERRKFGPIGWNIPYGFDESDFHISIQQLQMFINEQKKIPFEAITYLTGECNYGGRVTDDWDRRTLKTILADFVNERVITDDHYTFNNVARIYGLPRHYEYRHFLSHIKTIPTAPPPEVFGLHRNAGITRDLQAGRAFLNTVLELQGGSMCGGVEGRYGDGTKTDDKIFDIAKDIVSKLPAAFDIETAVLKYPVKYEESLNTVLLQEMERFNKLLHTILTSLDTLQKALRGLVMLSPELEEISSALLINRVPTAWREVSYPTLKLLGSYISDLLLRINALQNWCVNGKPASFWLPGFFFPQSFLTGVMQNFARKVRMPIEELTFDFGIMSFDVAKQSPVEGCYIHGLHLDGARWDREKSVLEESYPRVLRDMIPTIHVNPILKDDMVIGERYICPLYETSKRHETLTTTAQSNNYILPVLLNTNHPPSHWVKRGVALLCQLDD